MGTEAKVVIKRRRIGFESTKHAAMVQHGLVDTMATCWDLGFQHLWPFRVGI
jgi:hypothetical protein